MRDSRERFSDRVSRYVAYRPGYPDALLDFLADILAGVQDPVVADIGSGTGKLSKPMLDRGWTVYGVEPNPEMRAYAEEDLGSFGRYTSVGGEAVDTGLPDRAFDLVTAAQAFHWFAGPGAVEEFGRIAKPGAGVVLVWNDRYTDSDGFHDRYENLIKTWCKEYSSSSHKKYSADLISGIFCGWTLDQHQFENHQVFDFAGLKGRLESSSYCPLPGAQGHTELMADLEDLFTKNAVGRTVKIRYRTELFYLTRQSGEV